MEQETQHILTTYGPSAAASLAVLAALGRPGSVEGIVRWLGDSIHGVFGWGGRLADRIADAFIRRLDSTTRANETLAIALQLEEEPRSAGTARRSAQVRSLSGAGPGVGEVQEGAAGPDNEPDTSD